MSYFNNPRTEEELKDQYRKLLSKYDYHDPRNEKLTSDMRKEYEEILMKIKRANGYRTPLEKVTDSAKNFVKNEINDYKTAKAAEKERVDRLRNHKYTKEEYIQSYNNVKYYLKQVIESMVKNSGSNLVVISRINSLDNITFYQWFNVQPYYYGNFELKEKYTSAREVLEYAIQSISEQTKTDYENNLLKMEDSLGKYFKAYYRECCDKYADPIEVAENERISQRNQKDNAKIAKYFSIFITFLLLTIPCAILWTGFNMGIVSLLILCLAYPIGNAVGKGIINASRKTTYSTFGAKEQKARVTQKKQYENGWAAFSVFRFILSLLGFK